MIGAISAVVILGLVGLVLHVSPAALDELTVAALPVKLRTASGTGASDAPAQPTTASPTTFNAPGPPRSSAAQQSTSKVQRSKKRADGSGQGALAKGASTTGTEKMGTKKTGTEKTGAEKKLTERDLRRAAAAVPKRGPKKYRRAKVAVKAPSKRGRLVTYDVSIERNLALDPDVVARQISTVLNDKRSWRGTKKWRFKLVDSPAKASLHAYVVTPRTTDKLCAPLLTRGKVSCQNGDRVVLNAMRWMGGARGYGADRNGYRRYLINHEFGHSLGFKHVKCPKSGARAPVMMQQTKGLHGCRPNPWPTKND